MSLESKIELLNESIIKLIEVLSANQKVPVQSIELKPIELKPTPTQAPTIAPTEAPTPAPTMPPAPSFMATPAPVQSGIPFTDGPGLTKYVMESYKKMGAEKGALIQNVLTSLGYQNINDIQPQHYAALYSGVEALKG